jgi:hypothetical protein
MKNLPLATKALPPSENSISSRHPGAGYLNTKKNQISNLQKKLKRYLDVTNFIHYNHAIFHHEIPCCVGSAKKTNWSNFGRKKIGTVHALRSVFYYLPRTQYKVF